MSKYIATKLHQLIEGHSDPMLEWMLTLPHFVIDERLVALFRREDLSRSIAAVIEAEVAHLPYPEMVVEFDVPSDSGPAFRVLVRLEERDGHFRCDVVTAAKGLVTVTRDPVIVTPKTQPEPGLDVGPAPSLADQVSAAFAAMLALLMLNIQGIEKEVIDPIKLNKARQDSRKNRPRVPRHTVLRIATVVNSTGQTERYIDGRHMPVHLRAGHVRHQAYGPGHTERKLIYIPPVLVNFHAGDEIKQPKRILSA